MCGLCRVRAHAAEPRFACMPAPALRRSGAPVTPPPRPTLALPPRPALRRGLWALPLLLSLAFVAAVLAWLRANERADLELQRLELISDALSLESQVSARIEREAQLLRDLAARPGRVPNDAPAFAAMPEGSSFINVSRGEIAVQADVVSALASGHLAGAYLDVFEKEPLDPASPLWDMPNVLISPHTASHSLGQNEAIFDIFLDNLARFRRGEGLRNDVDNLG